jgi:hypothetical protein
MAGAVMQHRQNPTTIRRIETFEKWLRRGSKIFFASDLFMSYYDKIQAFNFNPGKAKNL